MTPTPNQLRAQLDALQAEHDAFYAALLPLAQTGGSGRVRWKDVDIAEWLGTSLDRIREKIVADLDDFVVDDSCTTALLGIREVVVILDAKTPRGLKLNFLLDEITALVAYLRDLSSDT